jgi:hypothetical protein
MSDNTEQKVSLSLGDLQAVMNLIDLCSSRGAFRANELEGVGRLHNHLGMFIKQTQETLEDNTESNASAGTSNDNENVNENENSDNSESASNEN